MAREAKKHDSDRQRLAQIAGKAKATTEKSQRRQEKAYAAKRKPRNRRVGPLAVGSRCRVSLRSRTNRNTPVQTKVWERAFYTVTQLGAHKITLQQEGRETTVECLREDVLPTFTPASRQRLGDDDLGGSSVVGMPQTQGGK